MPALEFEAVTKAYGGARPALEEVSFSLAEGDFALLLGASGAGKTTLLRLVLALERPDAGTIRVAGRDIARLRRSSIPYLRRNVGAVFQDFKLLEEATPLENVRLGLEALGWAPREVAAHARAALAEVDLDPELRRAVRTLSAGEKQRVAIARALAGRPAIVVADEPTGNLDQALTREILLLLGRIKREGTTLLLATHDPLVINWATGTRVLQLEGGRLCEDEDPVAAPLVDGSTTRPEAGSMGQVVPIAAGWRVGLAT